MFGVTIVITGDKRVAAKFRQMRRDLSGRAMRNAMMRASKLVSASAIKFAPYDLGGLQLSIKPEVKQQFSILGGTEFVGVVGSPILYSPYQEFGTGIYVGRATHWPPGPALHDWALRHGFSSGYEVARIIGMRGGLRPKKYLERAVIDNERNIFNLIGDAVVTIVAK